MAVIERIKVEGFKSITSMDLELRKLNVLIGANGSGKSNFLSLFRLLDAIAQKNLQVFVGQAGGPDSLLHFSGKVTSVLAVQINFTDQFRYDARLIPTKDERLIFEEERYVYDYRRNQEFLQYVPPEGVEEHGHRETVLHKFKDSHVAKVASDALANLHRKVYHFGDTTDSARVRKTGDIKDIVALRSDASNLAAMLYRFQTYQPTFYDHIVNTIQLAAPFFDNFALQPVPENPNTIMLRWRQKGSDLDWDASYLSDGTLRFICLTTLLMQPDPPPLIIIDEPELGLHPYSLNLLASMIRSVTARSQVIISTQSAPLVSQFEPEEIIVVEQIDGASIFKRQSSEELKVWLDDYSLGELWEKNVMGGRPHS